uniref:Uncharacterized protein n=1 Tax=Rhizophora mucronata TaxID=61149 RepID=A0A2P2IYA2_RHIMU
MHSQSLLIFLSFLFSFLSFFFLFALKKLK